MNFSTRSILRDTIYMVSLFFLAAGALYAQPQGAGAAMSPFIVKGMVVDAASSEPMSYTTVSLFNAKDSALVTGAVTDDAGVFLIETKPGRYYLVVEFIGYESYTINEIALNPSQKMIDVGTIKMGAGAVDLTEVEVRAEKSTMQFNLDKKVFNVGKDLANQGGSATDILDNVPSVTVDVEGNVSLRGQGNVRILVDGKPSSLVGSDGSGLRQIPANMIERIEVVTNPSARYDAEGMTGIINIVLKKEKKSGLNGSFDFNIGYPQNYGTAINLNYRRNKVNFFVNYGIRYEKAPGGGNLYQELYRDTETVILDMSRSHLRGGFSNNIRTGIDYFVTDKITLTGALSYRIGGNNNVTTLNYYDYLNSLNNLLGYSDRVDNETEDESKLEYSINFKRTFDKKERLWTADIQYSDSREVEASEISEEFFNAGGQSIANTLAQRSTNDEFFRNMLIQTDYVHPIGDKGKIETGVRLNLRNVNNDILVEEQDLTEWFTLSQFSNDMRYRENIYAAYVMAGNKTGKWSYQAGLRYEYSDIETYLVQTDDRNPRKYGNFFPSAVLGYEFSERDALQLSYSRRIRRPDFRELNPFYSFSDARNFFAGNPNVNPEYTDAYEIGYLKYFKKGSLTSSIYYRHTEGVITRIREVDSTGFGITLPQNIGFDDSYGFEINGSFDPFKWWRLSGDANFFRSITDGRETDEQLYSDTYTWFARLTSRMTIYKSVDVQLRGNYRAPRKTPQGSDGAMYSLDLGISRDILKKKGTLTLSVSDVFNTRRRFYTAQGVNFFTEGDFQWRARQTVLALNYRLNQDKRRQGGRPAGGGEGGGEGGW